MFVAIILISIFVISCVALAGPFWVPKIEEMSWSHKRKKLQKQTAALQESKPKRPRMSMMANHVLDEFYRLPKDNRPFTAEELIQSLVALDVKFGIEKVNGHFVARDSYGFVGKFTTNCGETYSSYGNSRRSPHYCPYQDYKDFLSGMKDIHTALEKQKKALALSAVQHELDAVPNLTKALREESKIVNTVTDELC